ncbi:hypothetical protein HHO41_11290 [Bacillus sp. DNRA2]|uniref:hypothetical protein n=1 Tax=Bacillus sp. DNRA2 TaxID=2723053 RepID=UPI00145DC55F|nr:hypothetical protein [Bacillus sp. DNRA2]NMD70878.1 hypothetical protein [Bacillus sp. DNRA2]
MFATWGIMLGLVLFIFGMIVSDFIHSHAISAAGIGVLISAMVIFGFGMCVSLMEEYSESI